jgi:hypothetical protein
LLREGMNLFEMRPNKWVQATGNKLRSFVAPLVACA